MADKIKGITVEINGDTSPLKKAIRSVNTTTKELQKELRGVNSLLKVDPKNVDLLKQKQELLNTSISATKDKLNALKNAKERADNDMAEGTQVNQEEYRNLIREIASTEQSLKKLTDEAKAFGSVGAQQVAVVGKKVEEIGGKIEGVGKKLTPLSAGAAGILIGSGKAASDFTDAMAKVDTIADTSEESLEDLRAEILKLSGDSGVAAGEIADATYNAISAGQKTGDAVNFVANATRLARAGFTDTASSIDVLTTILNAYKMEASEVTNVSDMLIQTQNLGKTTVAELASSIGKVIPTANSMNVGLEQLCASYAILTANGIATAETTTYVNSMLNELGKSGTGVSDVLKQKTGKSFQELMASGMSLGEVLQILKDYASESGKNFNDLWSSAEAGKAGIALLSGGVEEFNDVASKMVGSSGATANAIEKLNTPSQQFKESLNKIKNSAIELGNAVMTSVAPMLEKLAEIVDKVTTWFNGLSDEVKQNIVMALAITAALAPLLILIGKFVGAIGTIMTYAPQIISALSAVKAAFAFLAGPVGIVIAAVGALIGIFVHLYNTNQEFHDNVLMVWENIKNFFTETLPALSDSIDNFFGELPGKIADKMSEIITALGSWASSVASWITAAVPNLINSIVQFFSELPGKIGYAIGLVIGYLIKWHLNVISWIITNVPKIIENTVRFFAELPEKIKSAIDTLISKLSAWKTNIINWVTANVPKIIENVVKFFAELPGKVSEKLGQIINKLVSWVNDMVNSVQTNVPKITEKIVSFFSEIPQKVYDIGKNIVTGLWNGIKGAWSKVTSGISSLCCGTVSGFESAFKIHSPSRVMRDQIGKNIALGVAEGIANNAAKVTKAVDDMADKVLDAAKKRLDNYKIYNDLALVDEVDFWAEMRNQLKEGTNARLEADKTYFNKKEELDNKLKQLDDSYAENYSNVKDNLIKDIKELENEYASSVEKRADSISASMSLFDEFEKKGSVGAKNLIENLESQVTAINDYSAAMNTLRERGVGEDFLSALEDMGMSSLSEIQTISAMTDAQLDEYVNLWHEKMNAAHSAAVDELAPLKEDTITQIQELVENANTELGKYYDEYKSGYNELGLELDKPFEAIDLSDTGESLAGDMLQGIISGITDNEGGVIEKMKGVFEQIAALAKEKLGNISIGFDADALSASAMTLSNNAAYAVSSNEFDAKNNKTNTKEELAEIIAATLLEGLNYIGNSIFEAIPKEIKLEINGKTMAVAVWDDFSGEGGRQNRMFAPSKNEIYDIAVSAAESVMG